MKRFEIPQYQWDSLYDACGALPDVPNIGFYTLRDRKNDWPVNEDFRFYDQKARMYGDEGVRLGELS
jgi:hypothetical protein